MLYTTTELKVVRNYLIALWIADIGHIAVCYVGLGFERFVDVASWNSMTWGNVGATVSGGVSSRKLDARLANGALQRPFFA